MLACYRTVWIAENIERQHRQQVQLPIERGLDKGRSDRKQKDRLNIENDEDQGKNVILHFELYPGVANRLNTTLIGRLLDRIRLLGVDKICD